jgi:hypothetical protein
VELDITGLVTAGRDELLEQWRTLIGQPPHKHISRALLIQILAFGAPDARPCARLIHRVGPRRNTCAGPINRPSVP